MQVVVAAIALFVVQTVSVAANEPKKIIIDTDFLTLPDDAGAIAVANALMQEGHAEIIGVASNINSSFAIPGIDAINYYYNHHGIPYGQIRPPTNSTDNSTFITGLLNETAFPRGVQSGFDPAIKSPVDFYKNLLKNQANKSVTILALGFLNNLHDLYYSDGGPKLIGDKVAELVVQGGDFGPLTHPPGPNRAGYNLAKNATAAEVLEIWPSNVTYLGGNIGRVVYTGGILENFPDTPPINPVKYAYDTYHNASGVEHQSWDLLATYYGILGISEGSFKFGNQNDKGRIQFSNDTAQPPNLIAVWNYSATAPGSAKQHFLNFSATPAIVANRVDALLAVAPK